jgi:hypothetical protein
VTDEPLFCVVLPDTVTLFVDPMAGIAAKAAWIADADSPGVMVTVPPEPSEVEGIVNVALPLADEAVIVWTSFTP